jgi:hypothetical protein
LTHLKGRRASTFSKAGNQALSIEHRSRLFFSHAYFFSTANVEKCNNRTPARPGERLLMVI